MEFNRANLVMVRRSFRAFFLEQMGLAKPMWMRLAEKIDSTDEKEDLVLPDGLGEMYARDGSAEKRVSIVRTYTITNKDKVNWVEIPKSAFRRDKLGAYNNQVKLMGQAAASYGDKLVIDLLTGGFTSVGPDGVMFFSASHPTVDGGVQSNLQAGALDATTYEAALVKLQSTTDYYGRPLEFFRTGDKKPKLIVGPSKRSTATAIVEVPTTTGGAGNPNYGTATVEVNGRLIGAYAGYWFLVYDDGIVKPLAISIEQQPELHMVTDPEDKDVRDLGLVQAWVEASMGGGYAFWQLAVGSPGT